MVDLTFQGSIQGEGAPNFLDGPYGIDVATIASEKIAAVVSFDDASLSLFNVDDPENPVLTDTIQGTGSPYYLDGASNVKLMEIDSNWYAIIASYKDNAVTIFDVDDPYAIAHTGEIVDGGGSDYLEGAYDLDVAVISATEYAIVVSTIDDAVVVIDISTPATPTESDVLSGDGSPNYLDGAHGVVVVWISTNFYACVVSQFDNSLTIVDINNPANISLTVAVTGVGSPYYLGGAHSIDMLNISTVEHLFITSYDEDSLVVYDISTPATPVYTGKVTGGQDPNWLEEPTCVKAEEINSLPLVFVTGYLDDSLVVFDVTTPSLPIPVDSLVGAGDPSYLGGAHDIFVDSDNVYVASYNEDTLAIFSVDVQLATVAGTAAITTSIDAIGNVGGQVWLFGTSEITTYIRAGTSVADIDWDDFEEELKKPHFYPIKRAFAIDLYGQEVDITEKVKNFDRVLWQIEQRLHMNEFTANDCRLELNNEDEDFDPNKVNNYFERVLSQPSNGYKVPIYIKVGYRKPDGTLLLMPLFYGLIIDVNTKTRDDVAIIDLQCVSRILRDASTESIGEIWSDQSLYGGRSWTHTNNPTNSYNTTIMVEGDDFPSNFPPRGYIRIGEEIIYYGVKTSFGFSNCIRGVFNTVPSNIIASGDLVVLVLDSGEYTEERFFQFPVYPVVKGSVISISSSDGDIRIVDKELVLGTPYNELNLLGYVDYDNGVLGLGGEPTDSGSIVATFRSCPRNWSYPMIVKEILRSQNLDISQVEDVNLTNVYGIKEPINYGRISHVWTEETMLELSSSEARTMTVDSSGNVYLGIGGNIVKWDGDRFQHVADLGVDHYIFRMEVASNGNIYGIAGIHEFPLNEPEKINEPKDVFKWDGNSITILDVGHAAYMNWDLPDNEEVIPEEFDGGQFYGFSIDETENCVWFIFVNGGAVGVARVDFDGTGYTEYSRPVDDNSERRLNFVDSGLYVEFFYDDGSAIQYDRLLKATEVWSPIGSIYEGYSYDYLIPYDVVYNSVDDNIYLNVIGYWEGSGETPGEYRGSFISTPINSAVDVEIEEYNEFSSIKNSLFTRYCGGVYSEEYAWYVRGTGFAMGTEIDPVSGNNIGDTATGHLYRVKDNIIEDMGALAWRPLTNNFPYIRHNVKGIASVLAVNPVDGSIFYIAADATVMYDKDYGFSFGVYGAEYTPVVRVANINDRNPWSIISELAKIVNYELGVSREGDVFWRKRISTFTQLAGDISDSDTTLTSDGTNFNEFDPTGGMIQIGQEVIAYTAAAGNSFTGCSRGYYGSTATGHIAPGTIWEVAGVITNEMAHEKTLKFAEQSLNWEEIYNHIIVPFGDFEAVFNWEKGGEVWEESSEYLYGKRPYTVDNTYLTNDDSALAEAIAWRYYNQLHLRKALLNLEVNWQPQLDLGDMLSVRQDTRTLLTYSLSRIRRMEVLMTTTGESFFVRILAIVNPSRYRSTVYDYDYDDLEF